MRSRIRPLELLNGVALALLVALVAIRWAWIDRPGALLLRYGMMALLLLAVGAISRRDRLPRGVRWAVEFYPAAFIPLIFDSLGPVIRAVRGTRMHDEALIAIDRALFGTDVTVWMERLARPWLNDLMHIAYATYYFLPVAVGLGLWVARPERLRQFLFTLTFLFYVSYAGYFLWPALGPRFAQAHLYATRLDSTPISHALYHTIDFLENNKTDVFPSGHTMITLGVLWIAWKRMRPVFWWILPCGLGLIAATMYCRYHYAIDVLAGAALAIPVTPLGERLYVRLRRRSLRRLPSTVA